MNRLIWFFILIHLPGLPAVWETGKVREVATTGKDQGKSGNSYNKVNKFSAFSFLVEAIVIERKKSKLKFYSNARGNGNPINLATGKSNNSQRKVREFKVEEIIETLLTFVLSQNMFSSPESIRDKF